MTNMQQMSDYIWLNQLLLSLYILRSQYCLAYYLITWLSRLKPGVSAGKVRHFTEKWDRTVELICWTTQAEVFSAHWLAQAGHVLVNKCSLLSLLVFALKMFTSSSICQLQLLLCYWLKLITLVIFNLIGRQCGFNRARRNATSQLGLIAMSYE